MRSCFAFTVATAGSSSRYLSRPRPSGLSSGIELVEALGGQPAELSLLAISTVASVAAASSGSSTSRTSPPVSRAQRLDRRLAGLAHSRRDVFGDLVADYPDPQRARLARSQLLAEQGRTERRQSAASAQSGPETIVVETSAMWWPAIAERPKVGFRPVRPQ